VGEKGFVACRLCGSHEAVLFKRSGRPVAGLSSVDFRITSADYGQTLTLVRCANCGLVQAAERIDVTRLYSEMEDPQYEETRVYRLHQARKLIGSFLPTGNGKHLLDVGAGSGALVEAAQARGWVAEGLEPSAWLAEQARRRGLPVRLGAFPSSDLEGPFDALTLIDVIEHVDDPLELLREAHRLLRPGGELLIVTPDVEALVPRIMGTRWWHFRLAHLTYFSRPTLTRLLETSGFSVLLTQRPSWYFPLSYLLERAAQYLPVLRQVRLPPRLGACSIPVNPLDSLAVSCRRL